MEYEADTWRRCESRYVKIFSLKAELVDVKYTMEDHTMVDMLLEVLPDQIEFERLKSSIYYGADPRIYTAARVRELVLAASSRKRELRSKRYE